VLDGRVIGRIEDSLVPVLPADAVVLVAGLTEHLEDLPEAPALTARRVFTCASSLNPHIGCTTRLPERLAALRAILSVVSAIVIVLAMFWWAAREGGRDQKRTDARLRRGREGS
jgi:hypothetical protein